MARKLSYGAAELLLRQASEIANSAEDEPDDLDEYLTDQLADPRFEAAFQDARVREALLRSLLAARHLAQLTQGTVAEAMGTTQSAVSELEGGVSDPRLSTLQRYARAVGYRIAAWAVPSRSVGDDIVTAFLRNDGSYLKGLCHNVPYSTQTVVIGQALNIQVAGATMQHIPEPTIIFVGRIEPSEDPSPFPTLSIMDGVTDITSGDREPPANDAEEYIRIIAGSVTP